MAPFPGQVEGEAVLVLVEHVADPLQALEHLEVERADRQVHSVDAHLARRAHDPVQGAPPDERERVLHRQVRVLAHPEDHHQLVRRRVEHEVVAVVEVPVAGGGVAHDLGGLVDRVVVQRRQRHGGLLISGMGRLGRSFGTAEASAGGESRRFARRRARRRQSGDARCRRPRHPPAAYVDRARGGPRRRRDLRGDRPPLPQRGQRRVRLLHHAVAVRRGLGRRCARDPSLRRAPRVAAGRTGLARHRRGRAGVAHRRRRPRVQAVVRDRRDQLPRTVPARLACDRTPRAAPRQRRASQAATAAQNAANTSTYRSMSSSVCCTEIVHCSSSPGVMNTPRFTTHGNDAA